MLYKIAVVTPKENSDYLVTDIIDGILDLVSQGVPIECRFPDTYTHHFGEGANECALNRKDFINYAENADLIFFGYRYKDADYELVNSINRWDKTIFVDGSEYKHDNRFDVKIQNEVLKGSYDGPGKIQADMLSKCVAYVRREKPYISTIIPFPFGIQRRYRAYTSDIKKDIDFVCIFGQEVYPELRAYVKKSLEEFCYKNDFSFVTSKTKGFEYDREKKAGRDDFYSLLARSKVGISIGGGGFDTLRFWETLANNCLLITERIDIFPPDSTKLSYDRIFQCNNLYDFQFYFEKIGSFLREDYNQDLLEEEYKRILSEHSTKGRVADLLIELKKRGVISQLPEGFS